MKPPVKLKFVLTQRATHIDPCIENTVILFVRQKINQSTFDRGITATPVSVHMFLEDYVFLRIDLFCLTVVIHQFFSIKYAPQKCLTFGVHIIHQNPLFFYFGDICIWKITNNLLFSIYFFGHAQSSPCFWPSRIKRKLC